MLSVLAASGFAAVLDVVLAEGNGALYAAVATAIVVSVLAPFVNGRVVERRVRIESQLRRDEARAEAELARQERRADLEDVRLATLAAKAEAKESADLAREESAAHMASLAAAQAQQQEALLASNNRIADATIGNTAEIQVIKKNGETAVHLADGALTASLEAQLWALKSAKTSHQLLLAYREGTPDKPTPADYAQIVEDEKRIAMLEAQLAARTAAMEAAIAGAAPPMQPISIEHAAITVVEAKPLEVQNIAPTDPPAEEHP